MQKNIILKIISLVLICFFLTSCGKYKATNENKENNKEQYMRRDEKISFNSKHYDLNEKYGVALSTLINNDMPRPEENQRWLRSLIINYPQLYNLEDEDKERRLNDILFKEALNIRDIINDRDYIEYNINYEIMEANEKIISILFTGFIHSPQKSIDITYTVTIDLSSERLMDLSEVFKVDGSFLDKFKNKEFIIIEDKLGDINLINELVDKYVSSYNERQHIHDFYLKNGTLGLVIPAPQAMNYIIIEGMIEE